METIFKPLSIKPAKPFTIFYYGHMLPLHGLPYVLEAAELLKNNSDIEFRIIGGKKRDHIDRLCKQAAAKGARIKYETWLAFNELPQAAAEAGLNLGGPFGDTLQSEFVITGKTYQFLAMGLPVLIGHNQVNGLFHDKENCLMVPQANAKAIAEAIEWAAHHPDELKKIGQAGRELYQKHFSQKIVNKLAAEIANDLAGTN